MTNLNRQLSSNANQNHNVFNQSKTLNVLQLIILYTVYMTA